MNGGNVSTVTAVLLPGPVPEVLAPLLSEVIDVGAGGEPESFEPWVKFPEAHPFAFLAVNVWVWAGVECVCEGKLSEVNVTLSVSAPPELN